MILTIVEVEEFLEGFQMNTTASGLHGMIAGLTCAGVGENDIDNWLPVLCFESQYVSEDEYRMLEQDVRGLYREVLAQLDEFGVEFSILLPHEGCSPTDRIVALTSWCTEYLRALMDYGEISLGQLSEDGMDFISDVQEMTELDPESDPTDEDFESSFMILDEHLRIGVQLIYEQLNMHSLSGQSTGAGGLM
ncbi:MAG: YecA family protein [Acidiferrobacterales bacterium]|nr:YecA family protein [Acidiferrobacterales bacterium]